MRSTPWWQGLRKAVKYHRTPPPILGSLKDTLLKIDKQCHSDLLEISQLLAQHKLFGFGQVKMQWKPARKLSVTKVSSLKIIAALCPWPWPQKHGDLQPQVLVLFNLLCCSQGALVKHQCLSNTSLQGHGRRHPWNAASRTGKLMSNVHDSRIRGCYKYDVGAGLDKKTVQRENNYKCMRRKKRMASAKTVHQPKKDLAFC